MSVRHYAHVCKSTLDTLVNGNTKLGAEIGLKPSQQHSIFRSRGKNAFFLFFDSQAWLTVVILKSVLLSHVKEKIQNHCCRQLSSSFYSLYVHMWPHDPKPKLEITRDSCFRGNFAVMKKDQLLRRRQKIFFSLQKCQVSYRYTYTNETVSSTWSL